MDFTHTVPALDGVPPGTDDFCGIIIAGVFAPTVVTAKYVLESPLFETSNRFVPIGVALSSMTNFPIQLVSVIIPLLDALYTC